MLFVFSGRFAQPMKIALGVIALVAGIVVHQTFLMVAGAILLVWGAVTLFAGLRNGSLRNGGSGRGGMS